MNNPSGESRQKYLAKRLSYSSLADDNGVATIRDVPLLTIGEWHDQLTPYPTRYTESNLSAFKVKDTTGYRDHAFSHSIDEEIGEAVNLRYDADKKAILADLVFHGATQASRDTLAMIQRKLSANQPAYVSIEMMTRDIQSEKGMEARDITITGWIATTHPACTRCAIPKQQTNHEDHMTAEPKDGGEPPKTEPPKEEAKDKEKSDLEERVAALEKRIADTEKACSEFAKISDVKTLGAKMETSEARVKALEQNPSNKASIGDNREPTEPIADYSSKHYL